MPLYEYRCSDCRRQFMRLVRLDQADSVPDCPTCAAPGTKLVSAPALHRSESARLAEFHPDDARRPGFYRDPRNIGLATKRRLLDSNLDLGPQVDEIIERGRTGQILDDAR